ncbi:MAG: glycosyltransferase family 39 protein [Candidatus Methanoperedens sp.]
MENSEKKFLFFLIFASFFLRLIPAFLFISPPVTPHDFVGIVRYGESFLNGTLYIDLYPDIYPPNGQLSVYGPLFSGTIGIWMLIFGKSYYAIIIPYIIFDVLNVMMIYYIIKNISNIETAKYASVFFSLSYISLMNDVHGSTNMFFMFFMLLSLFFIIKDRQNLALSAVALAIGIGYKVVPLIVLPVILYYLYQIKKYAQLVQYALLSVGTFAFILLPFYLRAGSNVFFPYMPNSIMSGVSGSNLLTLYQYLDYFFFVGYSTPYENYVFPNKIATPVLLLGFCIIAVYILKNPLNNKKLELIRNSFLFIFAGLMFGKIFYSFYLYWIFPLVLIILFYIDKDKFSNFKIESIEIIGLLMVFFGILTAALLYRWAIDYSFFERLLILIGCIAAAIGTYMVFRRSAFRTPLSLLVLAAAFDSQLHAYVLMIFGSIIPVLATRKFAWGIMAFGINLVVVIGMIWLFKVIHDLTKEKTEEVQFDGRAAECHRA